MPPRSQPSPEAINGMLLDMLAGLPAKTTTIATAGRPKARPRQRAATSVDQKLQTATTEIASMLAAGPSWGTIQSVTGCSRATLAKIAKRRRNAEAA
jgi:hypothetical protein